MTKAVRALVEAARELCPSLRAFQDQKMVQRFKDAIAAVEEEDDAPTVQVVYDAHKEAGPEQPIETFPCPQCGHELVGSFPCECEPADPNKEAREVLLAVKQVAHNLYMHAQAADFMDKADFAESKTAAKIEAEIDRRLEALK